jgi:hypothetical protein
MLVRTLTEKTAKECKVCQKRKCPNGIVHCLNFPVNQLRRVKIYHCFDQETEEGLYLLEAKESAMQLAKRLRPPKCDVIIKIYGPILDEGGKVVFDYQLIEVEFETKEETVTREIENITFNAEA